MVSIVVAKAEPIGRTKVNGSTIHIHGRMPDFESLEAAEVFYEEEAEKIMAALATSLPQGTIHRLLIKMLEHTKCYYRGPGIEEE